MLFLFLVVLEFSGEYLKFCVNDGDINLGVMLFIPVNHIVFGGSWEWKCTVICMHTNKSKHLETTHGGFLSRFFFFSLTKAKHLETTHGGLLLSSFFPRFSFVIFWVALLCMLSVNWIWIPGNLRERRKEKGVSFYFQVGTWNFSLLRSLSGLNSEISAPWSLALLWRCTSVSRTATE